MSVTESTVLFGHAIRRQRSRLGITQEELSQRSGLHRTYIASVERGARNPTLKSVLRIAEGLEISAGDLLCFDTPSSAPLKASLVCHESQEAA